MCVCEGGGGADGTTGELGNSIVGGVEKGVMGLPGVL